MVLQNCNKVLQELSIVEERIKQIETILEENSIDYDKEEMLKRIIISVVE